MDQGLHDRALDATPQQNLAAPRSIRPATQSLSFLVAEDDDFSARVIEWLLTRQGHRVRRAIDGHQAIELAIEGGFDILLLDLHMPGMDGIEVARALRDWEQRIGGHLPVIALTADLRKEDVERCLDAGMDDFLSKPIRLTDLSSSLERALNMPNPIIPCDPNLIDAPVLLAAIGEDEQNFKAIRREFLKGLPEYLSEVETAFRDGDSPRLSQSAHKLAGMISAFSTKAATVASDIAELANRRQLEMAGPLVGQLWAMAHELVTCVQNISVHDLRINASRLLRAN